LRTGTMRPAVALSLVYPCARPGAGNQLEDP
jgi:hypothetical protein